MRTMVAIASWLALILAAACSGSGPAPVDSGASTGGEAAAVGAEAAASDRRNPFDLDDVVDCCGPDSVEFAQSAPAFGEDDDANAASWGETTSESFETIDGTWGSRWNDQGSEWEVGTANVRSIGSRIFIHVVDQTEYLIEAEREGDLLIGGYQNQANSMDKSVWVGKIVANDRIDGAWLRGRWDLRRAAYAP